MNESHCLCPETRDPTHEMSRYATETGILKYQFECLTCRRLGFRKKYSLSKDTWLEGSHLPVSKIIQLTFSWIMQLGSVRAMYHCSIGSEHTVTDWYSFCREVCGRDRIFADLRVGGDYHLVEVVH